MRSNAVGGGGVTYFNLGVGWCGYDASTLEEFADLALGKKIYF